MTGRAPKILDIGNCDMDHGNISTLLKRHFQATVHRAHGLEDTLEAMRRERYDLVTINRVMDRDGADGLEIIKSIKADPELAKTRVMMITNFDEHQQRAQQAGAVPGFGKSSLHDSETLRLLSENLTGSSR
jgi:CheY-like chemotaxis protein